MTKDRSNSLLALRPQIPKATTQENTSDEERFQNLTIRPVIKLQHSLLILAFNHYFKKRKNAFFELKKERKQAYLEDVFQKDTRFKSELIGMVSGQFTLEEYRDYAANTSNLNKRMISILRKRMIDSMDEFSMIS